MKKILILLATCLIGLTSVWGRQEMNLAENNKLRIAEAAIMQLYVDSINESKLVEDA